MLAAALLLVVLGVVSPPPVESHGISRRSFVDAIPATMANDFDPASTPNYQAFGVITRTVASTSSAKRTKTVKRRCEGVLLSSKVVLTAYECRPTDTAASMTFEFMGDSIPITHDQFTRAGRYYLIKLHRKPKQEPSDYPFLSWYAGSESADKRVDKRYGIREESVVARKVYLSSWLAHKSVGSQYNQEMTDINSALQNCQFDLKAKLIALQCSQLAVCKGKTVLSGSAFFTFTQTSTKRIVSIAGLVSLKSSGSFCKRVHAPGEDPSTEKTPSTPECNDAYVCGRRFTEDDVKSILKEAYAAGVKFDDAYIPSGTRIGSFNMQGLEKFFRAYAAEQAETVRNVIERAEILALQEVGTKLTDTTSDEYKYFKKNIIDVLTGRALKAIDSFAFVYDSTTFSLVARSCAVVDPGTTVKCSFQNNVVTSSAKTFTIYNVHLTNAYASDRYAELRTIQSDIANMIDNNEIVMIAGDFNVGAGKTRTGGSQTNVFTDTTETMTILKDMQFPDPGPTTHRETIYAGADDSPLKESHFDRFAVSKNVRLLYTYYPEHTDDAGMTAGTINNAAPGEETLSGQNIPFKPQRISTLKSSCPPQYHNFRIRNQIDRQKYFNRELLACYPEGRRKYMPNLYRSRDLSDHLPVTFTHPDTNYKVATWNMRLFDPTIDPTNDADKDEFDERKEITKADKFETILNKFHIVAVQELQPKSRPNNVANADSAAGVKKTKTFPMNKKWYWSDKTPELGFAVNKGIFAKHCKEIDMTGTVGTKARPAFMCDFYEKDSTNQWEFLLTLINVHVRNVDSSTATGEKYHAEAEKNVDQYKTDAFLVGDFNAIFTDVQTRCSMAGYTSVSYTKFDKFTRLDYVWPVTQAKPGVTGCRVYNPEILRVDLTNPNSLFVFPDVKLKDKTKLRMKAFPVWNSVSDHYPVYMKFFVP